MGKTRLSLAIAAQVVADEKARHEREPSRYADGVYLIQLAPVATAEQIAEAIIEQLGLVFPGNIPLGTQLLNFLTSQHCLLLFDNFEHVLEGASLMGAILRTAPWVKILVTPRERLNVVGETVYALSGLSHPGTDKEAKVVSVDQAMTRFGAADLFKHHADRLRPGLALDNKELEHLLSICRQVEGLPWR